jgi:hypothetical protein
LEGDAASGGILLIWRELGWILGAPEWLAQVEKPVSELTRGKTLA